MVNNMIKKIKLGLLYLWVFLQIVSVAVVFFPLIQGQFAEVYDFLANTGLLGYTVIFMILMGIIEITIPRVNEKLLGLFDKYEEK